MDGDFRINIEDMARQLDSAEVISIYPPFLRRTILIDARFTDKVPPMVRLVAMAVSVEERTRVLRRLRPEFPKPKAIAVLPWPRYIESLIYLGLWPKILQRFAESGHKETVRACSRVIDRVQRLEADELAAVIKGENYHTMWSR